MNWKAWARATAIRCVRTFCTTILGVFTMGKLVTEVDWSATLLAAGSATFYIFILCLVAGLPEVDQDPAFDDFLDDIDRIAEERTDEDRRDGSEADHAED